RADSGKEGSQSRDQRDLHHSDQKRPRRSGETSEKTGIFQTPFWEKIIIQQKRNTGGIPFYHSFYTLNRYPTPHMVSIYWGFAVLNSIFSRIFLICTVTVAISPIDSISQILLN